MIIINAREGQRTACGRLRSVSSEVETVRSRLSSCCLSTCQRINSKWQHLVKWQPLVRLSRSLAPSLPILADITFKSLPSRSAEMVSEWPWPCSVRAIDILFPPRGIVCPYYRRIFKPSSCGWLIDVVQVCLIIWQHFVFVFLLTEKYYGDTTVWATVKLLIMTPL